MQEQVAAVRTIAEPLRTRLDIPPMQQHLPHLQFLRQLPQPLHTAFLQLRAAQEAFGLPADISISGMHTNLTAKFCRCCTSQAGGGVIVKERKVPLTLRCALLCMLCCLAYRSSRRPGNR